MTPDATTEEIIFAIKNRDLNVVSVNGESDIFEAYIVAKASHVYW